MKPTQAQREAAARAMFELEYKLMGSDWVIPEWDESHRSHWLPLASAGLAAAAIERDPDVVLEGTREGMDLFRKIERNAIIERCAQVCSDGTECGEFYAATIRALKDKAQVGQ